MFPHTISRTTETFTPSEIAFLYVFRSLFEKVKNLSKCLKSRTFTNLSDVVDIRSPHAAPGKTYRKAYLASTHILYRTNSANPLPMLPGHSLYTQSFLVSSVQQSAKAFHHSPFLEDPEPPNQPSGRRRFFNTKLG